MSFGPRETEIATKGVPRARIWIIIRPFEQGWGGDSVSGHPGAREAQNGPKTPPHTPICPPLATCPYARLALPSLPSPNLPCPLQATSLSPVSSLFRNKKWPPNLPCLLLAHSPGHPSALFHYRAGLTASQISQRALPVPATALALPHPALFRSPRNGGGSREAPCNPCGPHGLPTHFHTFAKDAPAIFATSQKLRLQFLQIAKIAFAIFANCKCCVAISANCRSCRAIFGNCKNCVAFFAIFARYPSVSHS